MLPVSACTILTFERREILDQSTFDTCSTHDFSNQNKLQQKCHQVGFFKNYKTTIKSFKNYYVLGFFENLAVFLFWFKTGNKKERQFRILLVFGAAKLMNSRNLVQGCWYKTNTLRSRPKNSCLSAIKCHHSFVKNQSLFNNSINFTCNSFSIRKDHQTINSYLIACSLIRLLQSASDDFNFMDQLC